MLTEDELLTEMPSTVVRADGDIELYKNGKLHNANGPAITEPNHEVYAIEGLIHRDGKPAEIRDNPSDGSHYEKLCFQGEIHRIDGSAEIIYNKTYRVESYFIHDKLHRIDGPAVIYYDATGEVYREQYWINGEKHREGDQPAVSFPIKTGTDIGNYLIMRICCT